MIILTYLFVAFSTITFAIVAGMFAKDSDEPKKIASFLFALALSIIGIIVLINL